jgi:hypothetical protein
MTKIAVPTWIVYRDRKGKLQAIDPMDCDGEDMKTIGENEGVAVGYVTAKNKQDAIDYIKALAL